MKFQAKLKKFVALLVLVMIGAGGIVLLVTGCSDHNPTGQEQLYTCGMHPQVIQNKPGNCPICGMKLTSIRKQPGAPTNSTNATINAVGGGDRKIKYYKSTMLLGETSQMPRKDSMGMDMAPVYEEEASDSA